MADKIFRAAIAGCGSVAQVHAQSLHALPGAELVACADIRRERADAMAAQYGAAAYDSVEAMLDAEKPDVLHICTPHPLHTPIAQMASQRGIAVFTEKPPVVTAEQWAQFEAMKGKVPVGICFQNRYNACVCLMKELLASPEAGRALGARAFVTWKREAPYYTDSGWRGTWETEGGGCLINQSIHTFDLLTWLLGEAHDVRGSMRNHSLAGVIEVEDTV